MSFLMRNHQSCPTGSKAFPEVNAISSQTRECEQGRGRDHGTNFQYHGMVVIIQILRKGKYHGTTRSGIIPK